MLRVMSFKQLSVWIGCLALVILCLFLALDRKVDDGEYDLVLFHWDNGGKTETDVVKEVCRQFTLKTGIKVKVEIISSYESQFSNFMAAKNVPDVFLVPDGNFGQWVDRSDAGFDRIC